MRVLVTGANGMLGRNIAEALAGDTTHETLLHTRKDFDLRDKPRLRERLAYARPDLVIHTAAKVGGIQANLAQPVDFLASNIDLDSSVITSSLQSGVKKFIYIGSSCMYPKDYRQPLRETDLLAAPLEPTNEGYALAKIVGSKLCEFASDEKGVFYKTIIPSNLYGPGDSFSPSGSHLLASVIRKVHLSKVNGVENIEVWGSGEARREFTYIKDVANWIVANLQNLESFPARLNIGAGYDMSVNEFYQKVAQVLGVSINLKHDLTKPQGMKAKLLDSSLASEQFDWKPSYSLEEGVIETYEWFLENAAEKL